MAAIDIWAQQSLFMPGTTQDQACMLTDLHHVWAIWHPANDIELRKPALSKTNYPLYASLSRNDLSEKER